ncbi:A17 family peptidase, partial [Streptococcus dysgalactiae]|uniref:A17 family peptidase n=1 Tax=Streptococcus dysgalactiae TaxID=1334 RepID=UPI0019525ACE
LEDVYKRRHFLSFLYWKDLNLEEKLIVYDMNAHPFGAKSSPFCANFALRKTAEDNDAEFLNFATSAVRSNFYVDDILLSLPSEKEAVSVASELVELLRRGGFNLTKWASNKPEVVKALIDTIPVGSVDVVPNDSDCQRALGMQWFTRDDAFYFTVNLSVATPTRRGILRCVASFYDPLGFVAPVLLPARKLLQELTYIETSWDAQVNEPMMTEWRRWLDDVRTVESVRIPRCLVPGTLAVDTAELHLFSDASQVGYGAVGYLRFKVCGVVHCRFLVGKSRVAPRKCMTIPHLELVAAVLASKLLHHLIKE